MVSRVSRNYRHAMSPTPLPIWGTVRRYSLIAYHLSCIMLEMFTTKPIFQGNDEIHQLEVIYSVMGTPDETSWPGVRDLPWYELVRPKQEIASKFREQFNK